MFKIWRIKTLQDSTPSRKLANEFINEQGSCATLSLITFNPLLTLIFSQLETEQRIGETENKIRLAKLENELLVLYQNLYGGKELKDSSVIADKKTTLLDGAICCSHELK